MMRVLYFELKQNIPLYHHQLFVELIEKLGTPMGYHHFERRSAQFMGDIDGITFCLSVLKFGVFIKFWS